MAVGVHCADGTPLCCATVGQFLSPLLNQLHYRILVCLLQHKINQLNILHLVITANSKEQGIIGSVDQGCGNLREYFVECVTE